jgi:hypothetical protein
LVELEKVEELDGFPGLGTRKTASYLYPVVARTVRGRTTGLRESQLMQRGILDYGMVLKTSHAENATWHR